MAKYIRTPPGMGRIVPYGATGSVTLHTGNPPDHTPPSPPTLATLTRARKHLPHFDWFVMEEGLIRARWPIGRRNLFVDLEERSYRYREVMLSLFDDELMNKHGMVAGHLLQARTLPRAWFNPGQPPPSWESVYARMNGTWERKSKLLGVGTEWSLRFVP